MGHGKRTEEKFNQAARLRDKGQCECLEQIPYFTAYILGLVLRIKKVKITNFPSQYRPLC